MKRIEFLKDILMASAGMAVLSCKESTISNELLLVKDGGMSIEEAKKWYVKNFEASFRTNAEFLQRNLIWKSAVSLKSKQNKDFVVVAIGYDKDKGKTLGIKVTKEGEKITKVSKSEELSYVVEKAYFVKDSKNQNQLYFAQYVPDDGTKLGKAISNKKDKPFTGWLFVRDCNDKLIEGYYLKDGKYIDTLVSIPKNGRVSESFYVYFDVYYSWFGNEVTFGFQFSYINSGAFNQQQNDSVIPQDMNGGGNTGGYYFNCDVDTRSIQNQGLKNLINQLATNQNFVSKIANLFATIYGQSGSIRLNFKEGDLRSYNAAGLFNRDEMAVYVDRETLSQCSKEYAAAILVHEIFHAVRYSFDSMNNTPTLDEHKLMIENHFSDMVLWLKEITGLGDYDAKCIILHTFAGTFEGAPFGNPHYFRDLVQNNFGISDVNAAILNGFEYATRLKGNPL